MMSNLALYRDLGRRNKGLYWEYLSAHSFLYTKIPGTGYEAPLFLGYGSGEANNHCHNIGIIEKTKNLMIKEFNEGKYTSGFFKSLDSLYRSKLAMVRKVCNKDFSRMSNQELADDFDVVWKCMAEGNKPMLLGLKSQYLDEFFMQELKKCLNPSEDPTETAPLLLAPSRLTQVQVEEGLLLEIENQYLSSVNAMSKEDFIRFMKKYEKGFSGFIHRLCGAMPEPWLR
jgi:hypothetical protein